MRDQARSMYLAQQNETFAKLRQQAAIAAAHAANSAAFFKDSAGRPMVRLYDGSTTSEQDWYDRGMPATLGSAQAKAAIDNFTVNLSKQLAPKGITVNAVGSNYVENPDYFPPALLANKDAMAKMTAQIPLGRLGKSAELGAAVCFLCSDGAGFITGHVLPHAGGWA